MTILDFLKILSKWQLSLNLWDLLNTDLVNPTRIFFSTADRLSTIFIGTNLN